MSRYLLIHDTLPVERSSTMSQRPRGFVYRPDLIAAPLCFEAAVVFAALTLFGVAYPDRFRSRLWSNGGEEGWCSNPRMRIYFYANHEEPPEIPLIWSQRLTTSNMATAVLGATIFFARLTMAALQYEARWTNLAYDAFLCILWACSAAAQNGPDLSDPHHLGERPWYLSRSCDEAWPQNRGRCRIAKWEYAWSIFAAFFYVARILGSLGWSMYEKGRRDGVSTGRKALSLSECDLWTEECDIALYKDDAYQEDRV